MALHLRLKPKTLSLIPLRPVHPFSSSAPPPDSGDGRATAGDDEASHPEPPSSYSSFFSEIKERLKSPPSPPRRIPSDPPPPPPIDAAARKPPASFDEIRRHLAGFRLESSADGGARPAAGARPSSPPSISFQDLLKNNVLSKAGDAEKVGGGDGGRMSFDAIRESLHKFRPQGRNHQTQGPSFLKAFQESLQGRIGEQPQKGSSLLGGGGALPESIFGKELREKKTGEAEGDPKALKTEFLKMYSFEELGEKLRKLRPEAAKGDKDWFSLTELNERLAKLREVEEKETESRMGGVNFADLRESLQKLRLLDANKKANAQRLSMLANIGGLATKRYMLKPPQEQLVERYFHPDHMSSAEKMKLELKRVRDEFKMSESDCGSARVQVAQLTTKIKHLSTALHKKDKHSRKGLQEMVQRRKKLLKYLRRTDWDSYCLVLSKLGLRDVPEYKQPDYKMKS